MVIALVNRSYVSNDWLKWGCYNENTHYTAYSSITNILKTLFVLFDTVSTLDAIDTTRQNTL